jgi:hypothetical protein
MFCASEKTPGHQKAARRGGEKDEGIFQRIGLSGSWTWPAEYPFTVCTIAPEPYRKMMPRLPDGHQIQDIITGFQPEFYQFEKGLGDLDGLVFGKAKLCLQLFNNDVFR